MKHAYLIIAHNEFAVLRVLLELLDDPRNDIYIHVDKKVRSVPELHCKKAGLYILTKRIDVRWGHVSQIEAEYALFDAAYSNAKGYSRYHLISGTHLPLKKQHEIHSFFKKHKNQEIFNYLYTNPYEVNMKLGRYHFFVHAQRYGSAILRKLSKLLWHIALKIQYILKLKRKEPKVSIKANNWLSLTEPALRYVLEHRKEVMRLFKWTFCADEFFVPYLLENAGDKFQMLNDPHLLFNEFAGISPRILGEQDFDFLMHSEYLFARKFSEKEMGLVEKIKKLLLDPLNLDK